MTCPKPQEPSKILDRMAFIGDALAYGAFKLLPKKFGLAAVPISHIAFSANLAAAAEEISNPRDVVPLNIFGELKGSASN
jgi:hypothetical protein